MSFVGEGWSCPLASLSAASRNSSKMELLLDVALFLLPPPAYDDGPPPTAPCACAAEKSKKWRCGPSSGDGSGVIRLKSVELGVGDEKGERQGTGRGARRAEVEGSRREEMGGIVEGCGGR